jgi:Phage-related tail fibre protein
MQQTPNLGLKKPEGTDVVDIANLNDNSDILDSAVAAKAPLDSPTFTGTVTAANLKVSGPITSTVATGSAPMAVTSTTKVTNLNADKLDGYDASTTAVANTIPVYNSSAQLVGGITGNAATATKLATARAISLTGDGAASVTFDGSAAASGTLTLSNSGVSAGTYRSVTVDAKGRVTAGTNPTTISGYGITDAAPLSHVSDLTSHVPYAAATGSANAYAVTLSPAPTALAAGLALAVQINVANTGASTINVNGLGAKSILNSKGAALTSGKLVANGVYTLRYNGTAFILQGEGGEYGTAAAGDVRAGKTIGTEAGVITGTLPVNATSAQTVTPGTADIVKAAGIYDGAITIKGDPDLVSGNIRAGVDLFGVVGSSTVVNTADAVLDPQYLLTGYSGYDDGVKKAGTMANNGAVTITPGATAKAIPAGYHNGSGIVSAVSNLLASNIKKGVVVGGVSGTYGSSYGDLGFISPPATSTPPIPNFSNLSSCCVDSSGNFYVTGSNSTLTIYKYDKNGSFIKSFSGAFWNPDNPVMYWYGGYVYVATLSQIYRIDDALSSISFIYGGQMAQIAGGYLYYYSGGLVYKCSLPNMTQVGTHNIGSNMSFSMDENGNIYYSSSNTYPSTLYRAPFGGSAIALGLLSGDLLAFVNNDGQRIFNRSGEVFSANSNSGSLSYVTKTISLDKSSRGIGSTSAIAFSNNSIKKISLSSSQSSYPEIYSVNANISYVGGFLSASSYTCFASNAIGFILRESF